MMTAKNFPAIDRDMISNFKRAARSTTRNIAEGFGRHHHKENIQFCRISRGSLFEMIDDLLIAKEECYLDHQAYEAGRAKIERAIYSLNGYIKYLKSLT